MAIEPEVLNAYR